MIDFTKGNITKQIIAFSMPLLFANILQQAHSMVDAIIVGRFIGGSALAAVGISSFIFMFMLAILFGLATGASVLISQFYGARQEENLRRTVSTSFILLSILALAVSILGALLTPWFLYLLDVPSYAFADAVVYLRILIMGNTILGLIYNLFAAYLRALGDTRGPLYILMASVVLNLFLTLLFVVTLDLGVAGAAWSTILSQAFASILTYIYALKCAPVLRLSGLVFDREIAKSVLRYSIPAAIQFSLTSLNSLIIMRLVNSFGLSAAAGFTAAARIDQFAMLPMMSISVAISTFVAQNMGAGLEDRAKAGFRSSFLFMAVIAVVSSVAIRIFGYSIMALFVEPTAMYSPEIIRIGAEYLVVIANFYILFAIFFAFNGFFRGVGDAVIVMILTVTSLTIRTVSSYLLAHFTDLGPVAVAWAIPIGWTLCGIYCCIHYKKRLWDGKMQVKHKKAEAAAD